MYRMVAVLIACQAFSLGCAYDVGELSDDMAGEVESAINLENAISANAISANAISANAISANALNPSAIPAASMSALQSSGPSGTLARMLLKYLVSCSLSPAQSFKLSWKDSQNVVHKEAYSGALALAPDWASRPLNDAEQRWVSACVLSRVNYYGVPVVISLRGSHDSLVVDAEESATWSEPEGAFWGNIFAAKPVMRSCYKAGTESHSRSKMRDCAAGHLIGTNVVNCGDLMVQGPCDAICDDAKDPAGGYASCDGAQEVIATFLPE